MMDHINHTKIANLYQINHEHDTQYFIINVTPNIYTVIYYHCTEN